MRVRKEKIQGLEITYYPIDATDLGNGVFQVDFAENFLRAAREKSRINADREKLKPLPGKSYKEYLSICKKEGTKPKSRKTHDRRKVK